MARTPCHSRSNASKKAPKKEKWVPLRESLADKIEEIWASKPWVQGLSDVALTTAAGAWVVSFRGEGEVYLSAQVMGCVAM